MSTWAYCGVVLVNLSINDLWLHQLQANCYRYCSTSLGLHIILTYLHIILNIPVMQWVCGSTIDTLILYKSGPWRSCRVFKCWNTVVTLMLFCHDKLPHNSWKLLIFLEPRTNDWWNHKLHIFCINGAKL